VPLFILSFGWLALRVRVYDIETGVILPNWTRPAGIVLMITGGILVLTCIILFITRGKGTPAAFDSPQEFVATGPYAYVRNPMYIGGFILLAGFGLHHYSVSILILTVLLFIPFHLFVVFVEEPILERKFGKSYVEYKKHIKRWIPELKRNKEP
jgi:protein-S-isoprenylcysteine O-methyltransferase Ste14